MPAILVPTVKESLANRSLANASMKLIILNQLAQATTGCGLLQILPLESIRKMTSKSQLVEIGGRRVVVVVVGVAEVSQPLLTTDSPSVLSSWAKLFTKK
jgi:hypothetical protein